MSRRRLSSVDRGEFALSDAAPSDSYLSAFTAPRPRRAERIAAGKALRDRTPREGFATWTLPKDRPDPLDVIEAQNANRAANLVPIRMARMAASPFAFLRGTAAVMAADLAATDITGHAVMACGDMHVMNFGFFASAERNLIFSINDFDEAHPGSWEWDLMRLAASAAVAAFFLGGDRSSAESAVMSAVGSYAQRLRGYSKKGYLEVWYDLIDEATILDAARGVIRREAAAMMNKARRRGHMRVFEKLTEVADGQLRLAESAPLVIRDTHLRDGTPVEVGLDRMLASYMSSLPADRRRILTRYRIVDVARKVVGVGSVGLGCWVLMLEGLDHGDPLFLQVKEAQASVLAPYQRGTPSIRNQGKRVVVGQRMIQGSPDIFLGWGPHDNKPPFYYVRQLSDMKGGIELVEGDRSALATFDAYCRLCGWALALAHAKSGDAALIASYCGKSDALPEAMSRFALNYAAQTEADHAALLRAVKSGRFATA